MRQGSATSKPTPKKRHIDAREPTASGTCERGPEQKGGKATSQQRSSFQMTGCVHHAPPTLRRALQFTGPRSMEAGSMPRHAGFISGLEFLETGHHRLGRGGGRLLGVSTNSTTRRGDV